MDIPSFDLLDYLEDRLPRCTHDLASSHLAPLAGEDLELPDGLDLEAAPVEGSPALRKAVAATAGVEAAAVLVTAGASEANFLVGMTLLKPGSRVVVERPGYEPLSKAFEILGARVSFLPRPFSEQFRPDLDRLGDGDLLVLTNLHNPGGVRLGRGELEDLARRAEEGGFHVLVDEVFREAAVDGVPPCALSLSDRFVVTSSLTKVYGLGGLRVGWVLAPEGLRERLWTAKGYLSVSPSAASDALGVAALARADEVRRRNRRRVAENRKLVAEWVEAHDALSWVVPDGHVSFPRFEGDVDRLAAVALDRYGVLVSPGRLFGEPRHFRLCFGGRPETAEAGLEGLGRALRDL